MRFSTTRGGPSALPYASARLLVENMARLSWMKKNDPCFTLETITMYVVGILSYIIWSIKVTGNRWSLRNSDQDSQHLACKGPRARPSAATVNAQVDPIYTQNPHWGLVTPYGGRDLGQHWFRLWLVDWRHEAITWINFDLSSLRSSHLRAVSLEIS